MSKIAGLKEINADPANLRCTFKVTDPSVDYKAEIAKYAETNSHLADYSFE